MKSKNEMIEVLSKDDFLSKLIDRKINTKLIGGAVIDIIDGKKPKDYDFMDCGSSFERFLKEEGIRFVCETRTARTYKKNKLIVQILKTKVADFDFTISQSSFKTYISKHSFEYEFKKERSNQELILDNSYFDKILIPVNFIDNKNVLNSLKRIPHWIKKGYEVPEFTYLSLLNVLNLES